MYVCVHVSVSLCVRVCLYICTCLCVCVCVCVCERALCQPSSLCVCVFVCLEVVCVCQPASVCVCVCVCQPSSLCVRCVCMCVCITASNCVYVVCVCVRDAKCALYLRLQSYTTLVSLQQRHPPEDSLWWRGAALGRQVQTADAEADHRATGRPQQRAQTAALAQELAPQPSRGQEAGL